MEYKDYYKILGLTKSAKPDEVKKAYRKLAHKYHPDKNHGDTSAAQKFREISEANEVLSDSEKRKKYDEFGRNPQDYQDAAAGGAGRSDWSENVRSSAGTQGSTTFHFAGNYGDGIPDDFFEMLFGQKFSTADRGGAALKGADLTAEAPITLEEAYHGTSRMLKVDSQTIKMKIKPGSADQQLLRIPGKGGQGYNGPPGDLIIKVQLQRHPSFERRKDDLYCTVAVDLYTALLGGSVKVKTFKGTVSVNVPPETASGRLLKMSGLGMPLFSMKNKHGDLYARAEIQLPKNLSAEEKELFGRLREMNTSRRQ